MILPFPFGKLVFRQHFRQVQVNIQRLLLDIIRQQ